MEKLMALTTVISFLNSKVSKEQILKISKLPTYFLEEDENLLFIESSLIEQIIGTPQMRNMQCSVTTLLIKNEELFQVHL